MKRRIAKKVLNNLCLEVVSKKAIPEYKAKTVSVAILRIGYDKASNLLLKRFKEPAVEDDDYSWLDKMADDVDVFNEGGIK